MANIIRETIPNQGIGLNLYCGGLTRAGISITGTWTGVISFSASVDGLTYYPISLNPFPTGVPSGTLQSTTTINGIFDFSVRNYSNIRAVVTTLTSGTPTITIAASLDSSYQDAFLAATSKYVNQASTGGASTVITQAARTTGSWRLRTLTGGFSAAPAAAVKITVSDGGSATLWESYIAAAAGPWTVTLPLDTNIPGTLGGGVVNTSGNTMVVTLAAPGGSVASDVNCEFAAA